MLKNILLYLLVLLCAFVFNVFYYEWFSWYLLVLILCVPVLSLTISLPFMIVQAIKGFKIYVPKEVVMGDDLHIRIANSNGKFGFCPLVKIRFKLKNEFAGKKRSVEFLYGGLLDEHAYKKIEKQTKNCGCVTINAKYGKLYDMLGIFFIPVRLKFQSQFLIMPKEKEPKVMPSVETDSIIGYKPKMNGFAEEYELRNYQSGDSLKNIHWKISAKHDDLIVKEPSEPIYRPLIIKPIITNKPKENDITLAKLIYVANYFKNSKADVYLSYGKGNIIRLCGDEDITKYILSIYQKQFDENETLNCEENAVMYTITHSSEAVSA